MPPLVAEPLSRSALRGLLVSTAHDLGLYASPHAYGDEGIQRAIKAGVRSIEHGNLASTATLKLAAEHDVWFVPTQ